jgi:hypothetical protein
MLDINLSFREIFDLNIGLRIIAKRSLRLFSERDKKY